MCLVPTSTANGSLSLYSSEGRGPSPANKIAEIAKDTLNDLQKPFWWNIAYENEELVKTSLRISAMAVPKIALKVTKIISGLGVFAAIDALISLTEIPTTIMDMQREIRLKDTWNSVLSGVNLFVSPAYAFDSIMTFSSTICVFASLAEVPAFNLIALPLSLTLLGITAATTGYRVYEDLQILSHAKNANGLIDTYFEKPRKSVSFEPQTAAENRLFERVGSLLFKQLIQLKSYREDIQSSSTIDITKEQTVLNNLKTRTIRQIATNAANILIKIISLIALLLLFSPLSPFIAASLLVTTSLIRIGILVYEQYFLEAGLTNPFEKTSLAA